ncbi:MAG: hypothetical protein ACKOWW_05050 [Flavobacteriales bacterium]
MRFNKLLWRNILLAVFVAVYSLGLLSENQAISWSSHLFFMRSIAQGLLIGQFYYWLHERPSKFLQIILLGLTGIFYLWAYQVLWSFVFFWLLLLFIFLLAFHYENGLKWRKIPYLKNFLIPVLWFIFLNIIPGMSGASLTSSAIYIFFYFALGLQADREDLDQDNGQIKTIAGFLGTKTSGYVVIFLLALSAYLLLLPLTETLILLVVMNREQFFPKRSFDSLLLLLGLYFLFG